MKKIFFILADEIASITGLNTTVCRGMMRIVAEDRCGSSDPLKINSYIENMSYFGWENLINDKAFQDRLNNVGVKDVPTLLTRIRQTLIERQSLFTLGLN